MQRVRNAVIIIVLCIIGAMSYKSRKPLNLIMPTDAIKDSVANNGIRRCT